MKDADEQIQLANMELVLNVALAQLRVIHAHIQPVADQFDESSEERRYLMAGVVEMVNLHGYLTNRLNELTTGIADPVEAAKVIVDGAKRCAQQMQTDADAEKALLQRDADGERSDILIH